MSEHVITIDTPAASHEPTDDFAARAYCTDECGWMGDWHHADDYPGWDWREPADAEDAAITHAVREGEAHLAEVDTH